MDRKWKWSRSFSNQIFLSFMVCWWDVLIILIWWEGIWWLKVWFLLLMFRLFGRLWLNYWTIPNWLIMRVWKLIIIMLMACCFRYYRLLRSFRHIRVIRSIILLVKRKGIILIPFIQFSKINYLYLLKISVL